MTRRGRKVWQGSWQDQGYSNRSRIHPWKGRDMNDARLPRSSFYCFRLPIFSSLCGTWKRNTKSEECKSEECKSEECKGRLWIKSNLIQQKKCRGIETEWNEGWNTGQLLKWDERESRWSVNLNRQEFSCSSLSFFSLSSLLLLLFLSPSLDSFPHSQLIHKSTHDVAMHSFSFLLFLSFLLTFSFLFTLLFQPVEVPAWIHQHQHHHHHQRQLTILTI